MPQWLKQGSQSVSTLIHVSQWIWGNRKIGKVYSTDDALWQQEIFVIIGYNKTIMSMSDDFGT